MPPELQQRSRDARYFPTLESRMTRRDLEEIVAGANFMDFESAAINLRAALDELGREGVSTEDAARIWRRVSSSDKSTLFALYTQRLLTDERISADSIPDIVDAFLDREEGDDNSEELALLRTPEVRRVLRRVLPLMAQFELAPDVELLMSVIREELPRLDAIALEFERLTTDVDELLSGYDADIVWQVGVKFYNEGRSPGALLPVAVIAVQRPAQGNATVFMRADNVDGNIIVPPGEGVDILFRSSVDDNDERLLESLVQDFDTGDRDFAIIFQYLDETRIESETSNFSASVTESLRDDLVRYSQEMSLASDRAPVVQ